MLSTITAMPESCSRASVPQYKPPLHRLQLLPTCTLPQPPNGAAHRAHHHDHPTLIQSRGGYSMMLLNTMMLGILILVGMVQMNIEIAHAAVYTFYEGNEKFLILTYTDFFYQATAQSYCQGYTEGSTRYVLGLVRSSNQDRLLQEYLRFLGTENTMWGGAYSSGYNSASQYYNPFYWLYGYGGASTARSRKGVIIQPASTNSPGASDTSILYATSSLSYSSEGNEMYGTWGWHLRAIDSSLWTRNVVCVASKCNVADDPSYLHDNVECTGRGTLTGYYPNCLCVCMTGWTGVTCHIRTATRSKTFTLSSIASLSPPNTQSLLVTMSLSLPHTSSNPHTGTHSITISLPITHSLTSTQTLTESQTASSSPTITISLSEGTSSSTTTLSLSRTSSISGSESLSFTFSTSWSESSSQTTSFSSSTTSSLSASTSTSTSTTLSISLSPTEGSSTYTESFSESMSSTSNCGILEYAFGGPGLCIMLNTTGREDGLECNYSTTVRSVPTALMVNASSESVVPEAEFVPVADAAILSVDASVWASGTVIVAAVHVSLPLKLRNHWGNALNANSIGPDGLVEVTAFVNETSRSGVGRVLGSTTIRFYRYRGQELVPGGEGAWRPLPPSNASATGAGRAEVAKLLKGAPEGRIGMVVVYNGPRNDKSVSQTDSSMFFELDEKVIECGERIDRLAFGVRLEGLVTLASAVSEISQQALAVLQTVGTVTSAFTLMPSVVLQLGVQSSIKEMAECQNFWVDVVEAGVGKYRLVDLEWLSGTKLQQLTSPYGIGIGALGETHPTWIEGVENSTDSHLIQAARARAMAALHEVGQYYRGAILTSILNLTIFTVAVICAVFIVYIGRRYAGLLVPKATFKESILDAAAFVQVPSISLLGVSLLMDGLAEGSVTLISIRATFSSESDGYASVYRTTALEAGVTGQIMMSGVDGYLVAPGWTDASIIDMVLSAVSLSVVIIYIVHIAYVVTGKRLAVVLVPVEYLPEEDEDEETSPPSQHIENNEIEDEKDSCNSNNPDDNDIIIEDDDDDAISIVAASIGNDSLLSALTQTSATNCNHGGDHLSDYELAVSRSNNGSFDLFSDDGNGDGSKEDHGADKQPEGPQTWKMWRIEWFELQEHWVPPGDDSIGGPSYDAGVAWIRKYGMYVGGTTWAPYMVFELAIAFVVTGLEGYITSDPDMCTMKCTIALILLGFQLAAVLFFKPLAAKFDLRITTVSLSLSFIVGVLITLNITLQNVYITILADIITVVASMVASVYGIVGGINSVLSIIDVLGTVKKTFAAAQRRKALREQFQREYDAAHMSDEDEDDEDGFIPLPALIVEDINNVDHIDNPGIELEDLQQQQEEQEEQQNDEDAENEPELSEGEEKKMWTTYLVELEQKEEVPDDERDHHDEVTIAMRDAILPPLPPPSTSDNENDDDGNTNNDPTSSSAGLLNEVVSRVQPQLYEEEEWAAFFERLDANNNNNNNNL